MIALLLCVGALISSIDVAVEGRKNTQEESIRRLMNTRAGALLDPALLESDLVRLRATGVLYDVTADQIEDADGAHLIVRARDRWSLLPIFGLRHGGGRTTARIGIAERNALGRLVQLTAELQSGSDLPFSDVRAIGSLVTVLVPRIGGSRLSAGLSWQREFLDWSAWDSAGTRALVYDRARHSLRAEARFDVTDFISSALSVQTLHDDYHLDANTPAPGALPSSGRTTLLGAELLLGALDDRTVTMTGTDLRLRAEASRAGLLADYSLWTLSAVLRHYLVPAAGHTIGLLLSAQATDARDDSNLFRAGGLTEIRGFPDAYFLGQRLLRGNLEYRLNVLRTELIFPAVTQLAAFLDGGVVDGRAGAVGGLDYSGPIASAGAGVRVILLPITRAVLRVDVAVALYPRRAFDVSVGGQQFF